MSGEQVRPETTLAIILGASEFPYSSEHYPPMLSFENSAEDFRKYLLSATEFGLPQKNLLNLFDTEKTAPQIDIVISEFLQRSAKQARDLLIYYVGHGSFTGPNQDYYLALRSTTYSNPGISSLRMVDLARRLREDARDLRRFLILDSCFSAATFREFQSAPLKLVRVKTEESLPPSGTALLCSSSRNEVSMAPSGQRYTMFSGSLLEVLRTGDARLRGDFTLEDLGERVRSYIQEKYKDEAVRAQVLVPDQSKGDIARIPLFRNVARTELLDDVTIEPEFRPIVPPLPVRRGLSMPATLVLCITVACLLGAAVWVYRHYFLPQQTTLAVWGFDLGEPPSGNGPNSNPIEPATIEFRNAVAAEVSNTLYKALRVQSGLKLVSDRYLNQVRSLSRVPRDRALAPSEVPEVLGALGAGAIIVGNLMVDGNGADQRITIVADVLGPYGNKVKTFTAGGPFADLDSVVTALASQIRQWNGKSSLDQESVEQLRFLYPKTQETRLDYFSGVSYLEAFDGQNAEQKLESALSKEPGNILIHESLSDAEELLGHDPEARKHALKARDLANDANRDPSHPKITQETHLLADARAAESQALWKTAADDYRILSQLGSQPLEYGLRLATVLSYSNDGDELKSALDTLDHLDTTWPTDARINLARATILLLEGAYEKALASAAGAYELARQRNLYFLEAEADIHLCWLTQQVQQKSKPQFPETMELLQKFRSACTEGSKVFKDNNPLAHAVITNQAATRLVTQGLFEQALQMYELVIDATSNAHSAENEAGALLNKASVLIQLNRCDEADSALKKSMERSTEAHDFYDARRARLLQINASGCSTKSTTISDPVLETEKVVQDAEHANDQSAKAYALDTLGTYQLELGRFDAAIRSYSAASDLHLSIGEVNDAVAGTTNIGEALFRQGKFEDAEKQYQKALGMLPEVEKFRRAQVWLALANLAWERQDSRKASEYSSQAWDVLKGNQSKDLVSDAASMCIKAMILSDRRVDAQPFLDKINLSSTDPYTQVEVRTVSALYLWGGTDDDVARAATMFEEAIQKANGAGLTFEEFQVKLLRYTLLKKRGGLTPTLASEIKNFASAAGEKGFSGIEREARRL
jgi:tetratricopeptide (TPR) repeat protein